MSSVLDTSAYLLVQDREAAVVEHVVYLEWGEMDASNDLGCPNANRLRGIKITNIVRDNFVEYSPMVLLILPDQPSACQQGA